MSTPLPATATTDAQGSATMLDVEGNRRASVKSAKPDLLSFRPKLGSAVTVPPAPQPSPPPPGEDTGAGEGGGKGASRKASVATNLEVVEEVVEEQGMDN